jgi:hypothetical protein
MHVETNATVLMLQFQPLFLICQTGQPTKGDVTRMFLLVNRPHMFLRTELGAPTPSSVDSGVGGKDGRVQRRRVVVVVLVGDDQHRRVAAAPLDVLPSRAVLFAAAPVVSPAHSATFSVQRTSFRNANFRDCSFSHKIW